MTLPLRGRNALHLLRNGRVLRGHDWTRNSKLQISTISNAIKAIDAISGGVIVVRDFARWKTQAGLCRVIDPVDRLQGLDFQHV